ncbi:MAG: caspase family protein [Saprospiraceae bacterium]
MKPKYNDLQTSREKFKPKGIGEKKEKFTPEVFPDEQMIAVTEETEAMKTGKTLGKKTYVLSIGINKYQHERIPQLNGCVKDVERLEKVLKSRLGIPDAQYKTLQNEAATRKGIIDAFRDHFSQLKDGDTAILHYSGHGSQEPVTQDFIDARHEVPYGKNEVIVCHDSRQDGIYNIADKELRWLIHALQYPADGPPRHIHFVALFDCCHSGSMLRLSGEEIKVRLDNYAYEARPLAAYLGGQYVKTKKNGEVQLPPVNYISMTACSPNESAIEMASSGGLFTTTLCEVLGSAYWGNRFPSYTDLYSIIQHKIKNNTHNRQTPHFEYAGRVNPSDCFLQFGDAVTPHYPSLVRRAGEWGIALGAIHGIVADTVAGFEIPIFELSNTTDPIAYAVVTGVELEYTQIQLPSDIIPLNPIKTYLAGLVGRLLPVQINSSASEASAWVNALLENSPYQNRFLHTADAAFELRITGDGYTIYSHAPKAEELIYGVLGTGEAAARHILDQLSKIAKWEQINHIQNPKRQNINPEEISVNFLYEDADENEISYFLAPDQQHDSPFSQITISFDPEIGGIPFKIELKNNSKSKLWFYLIHLDRKFSIYQKHENFIKEFFPEEEMTLYDSYSNRTGLGFEDASLTEVLDVFLVIGSKEELSIPAAFEQKGFGADFGQIISLKGREPQWERPKAKTRGEIALKRPKANWMVKRLEVRVVKKE